MNTELAETPVRYGAEDGHTSSDNTAAATVPATITVATRATTANFTVTSLAEATTATANISATFNGGSQSAPMTVTPRAGVVTLTLNTASVLG